MEFFSRLDRIDNIINRSYARWGKRFWISIGLIMALFLSDNLWSTIWGSPTGGVTLIIHNELDRPILGFSVNGVSGSNAFAHGGGGTTCCGRISGKTAEIIWTLDITHEQFLQGLRLETKRIVIPLPKRKHGENDLHVHFLPEDKFLLGWSDNAWSPYEKYSARNIENIRTER